MLKSRIVLSILFGISGGVIGTTMGVAGSFFGFFFGAVTGILVFGFFGATLGWFAARDVEDTIATIDAKHPQVLPKLSRLFSTLRRGIYLIFGLVVLIVSKLFGLLRK